MRKLYLFLTGFMLLFISCNHDIDDNINPNAIIDEEDSEDYEPQEITDIYESTEPQFTTQEAIVYFTGSLKCTSTGEYFVDDDKLLENLIIPTDLPDSFDLSPFLPPIGNQGRQGSCISWATTYYLKSFQERIESGLPYSAGRIMSPAYTYNQITQGSCKATSFESTLNILMEKGAVSIESFPYLDYSCNIQPNHSQNKEAKPNKISDFKYLSGQNMVQEMKTLINDQMPILISAFLTPEFGTKDEFGLTSYREHSIDYSIPGSCHGMLVVGYSDTFNAFKVVNSWGEGWGDDGFVWIDYAAFENVHDLSTQFRVISTAIVVYDL